ncbi:MAG: hypothetical protein IKC85_05520 [Bacteroidaceae bacterium]|nr:hypothetical protein [Bacteroidaceae bacterium]
MKNLFIALSLLLYTSVATAQINITETFDGVGTLDWSEYADKDVSALIEMGVLDLEVKKEGFIVLCHTDLPVIPEYDFKVTAKLLIPKIDEKEFGILFDMDEDYNRQGLVFMEDKFIACKYNGNTRIAGNSFELPIKLAKSRDRNMEVTIERKGGRIIVYYDNIEIFKQKRPFYDAKLSFFTTTKLKVEELIVEQPYTGD